MTLLDAPPYDEARERRRRVMMYSAAGLLFVLFVGWWLAAAGRWTGHGIGTTTCWDE